MNNRPSATPATGKKTFWAWAVGTFFGAGLLKPGPGTWGSVAAMVLWAGIMILPLPQLPPGVVVVVSVFPTLLLVLLATAIGIPAATIVACESGRKDPGHVVIDEVAGQWLTLAVCQPDWPHALLGLGLFRLFDITKPWPIRKLEALPGGWGIMLDDLAAGLFGAIVLLIVQHWW
jgi:phosphatidylglycerophosphatase A